MADLAGTWAVTPNTVSRRLAYLRIKPIRQGNYRYLTAEQLEQANALHDHIVKGKPMEAFPRADAEASSVVRRLTFNSGNEQALSKGHQLPTGALVSDQAMSIVAAMAAKMAPVPDPLLQARRLKEAADLGVWLTNAELAAVLSVAESTLRDKSQDYSPRPGFMLERKQDSKGGAIWWRVRQETSGVTSLATGGVTSRSVGFGAIEASYRTISASVVLPVF